jgi:alpha-L-fucosidase
MMQPWFRAAKFGISLHWGIYAVNGTSESWAFYNNEVPYDTYMAQAAGFTASRYDPWAWAALFKRVGAGYAVLTTKHHDGMALWDTALSELHVARATPAGRDLVGPYCAAMREYGLKVGLYFSHLDWSHPDYAPWPVGDRSVSTRPQWQWDDPNSAAWQRFYAFHRGQLKELCERYSPDLLYFDGDWVPGLEYWRFDQLREELHQWQPAVVLNDRMRGYGDYLTPEQGPPIVPPVDRPFEFWMTLNNSWGHRPDDQNYKPSRFIIRSFAEVIGMGGNVMLNLAPREDGTIPGPEVERLVTLGAWIDSHREAIYPAEAGLPPGHHYGASTLSADRRVLYLIVFDCSSGEVLVRGLHNNVRRVTQLASGHELPHSVIRGADWWGVPGTLRIALPAEELDPYATVLRVELEGELSLYRGAGKAIESN